MLNKMILLASAARVAGGSEPFQPSDISGLALWLDADDAATIIKGGNDRVSQWSDKSGNEMHAAMVNPSYQPRYVASGISGKGSLDFENSRYLELPDLAGISGSNNRSYFAAFEHFTAEEQGYLIALGRFSTGQNGKAWRISIAAPGYLKLEVTGADAGTSLFPGTAPSQAACILDGSAVSDHTMWLNGISESLNGASPIDTDFGEASISQQNRGGPGGFVSDKAIDGLIAELLVYDSALSATDRQRVEGYLGHKWGIEGQLPDGHPYKSNPP